MENGRCLHRALFLVALAAVVSCGGPAPPTVAVLSIAASQDINPNPQGVASPVSVRVYQLTLPQAFQNADFFQLYRDDAATLGSAMLGRDEVVVAPGQKLQVTESMKPDARYIGVLVAYRDIDRANWRASASVPSNQTTMFEVKLDKLKVMLNGPP